MIPGIQLEPATEQRVWAAFDKWASHFKRDLAAGGVPWLVHQYATVVTSVETQSCDHGRDGARQTGEAWQHCCGVSYEYLNDISVRDAIQVLLDLAPSEASRALGVEVADLDDRLHRLYVHEPDRRGRWWRDGLPVGVAE